MNEKPLVWLHEEVRSPPLTSKARIEAGFLLRLLQRGEILGLPRSRPLPSIRPDCHELRIDDVSGAWRIVYKVAPEAIVILEVFKKISRSTPRRVIETCQRRLRQYEGIL